MLSRVFFPQCGNHFCPSFSQFVVHSYGHLGRLDTAVGALIFALLLTLATMSHFDRNRHFLGDFGPRKALHMVLLVLFRVCYKELHQILEFSVMLRTFFR